MPIREGPDTIDRPVRGRERLTHVDALRGVALLGILVVNLLAFSGPSFLHVDPLSYWEGAGRWLEWAVLVTSEGAFYTIFSVLFGWGFGRWMRTRGVEAVGRFARRLAWLLAIGLVHLFLIWTGDILTHYALIGFVLLAFSSTGARGSALWGLGMWAVGVLIFSAAPADPDPGGADRWATLYGDGTLAAILEERIERGASVVLSAVAYLPLLLGLFLLGSALAKSRAFESVPRERPARAWWARSLLITLPVGVTLKGAYGAQLLAGDESRRLLLSTSLGGPMLGLAYLALLNLAFTAPERPRWVASLEAALAAAGRTALTVYLSQSVVMTLFFFGYGLGLYGRVGPSVGLPIALGLFALQVAIARWWLTRFRFGPVEWLWRSLTYGRPQPWRRRGGSDEV